MELLRVPVACVFLLLLNLSLSAKGKKLLGEAPDPDRLLQLHNFCVSTAGLSPGEAADVMRFVDHQNGPKKLLGKLPWQLTVNCSEADAVAKFQFEQTTELSQATGSGTLQGAYVTAIPETAFKATILLADRASGKMLYKVQGEAVRERRDMSVTSPFSKLIKDLKTLSK